jgi:hypothetical protein
MAIGLVGSTPPANCLTPFPAGTILPTSQTATSAAYASLMPNTLRWATPGWNDHAGESDADLGDLCGAKSKHAVRVSSLHDVQQQSFARRNDGRDDIEPLKRGTSSSVAAVGSRAAIR